MNEAKRYTIEAVPLLNLYVTTDKQLRLRLSADIAELYKLHDGGKVMLGYDATERAIAIRPSASAADPSAANIDKRGYISARRFYAKSRIAAESRRYTYKTTQDGWLVFIAED